MKPSAQLDQVNSDFTKTGSSKADPTDLEFALETQSGFLIVVKGNGNDGKVTLAVRRRVGTPPASAIGLVPDEVKRLVNVLGELSPAAVKDRDKHLVGRARDSYLDDLMGSHNEPENAELDLFMERDFPELANRLKRSGAPKTFLGAETSNPIDKLSAALAGIKVRPKQIGLAAGTLVVVVGIALSTVAVLNYIPFGSHKKIQSDAVAPSPTAEIEDFSKGFVLDMLTFKPENYRQAQVRAMAAMTPELAQKYWQETGFPLTKKQLKSIPRDQEVQVATVTSLPIAAGLYQVDVVGSVVAQGGAKTMPLHIRLSVNKDGTGKLMVTEQKDLSSSSSANPAK